MRHQINHEINFSNGWQRYFIPVIKNDHETIFAPDNFYRWKKRENGAILSLVHSMIYTSGLFDEKI